MIGILLYVTSTRIDVIQDVGLVSRFQSSPKETHVTTVKIIFKYLKGTMEYGLWYPKIQYFILKEFIDVDWARSVDDRKSTSGAAFFLGNCLVSWLSKKQSSTSLSTVEVEYIVVASCCTQVIWMKHTLEDLLVKYEHPVIINSDNTSAMNMSKNPIMLSKTKHIPIKYHFLRERVSQKVFKLGYVDTKEQIVDIFTKPLLKEYCEHLI